MRSALIFCAALAALAQEPAKPPASEAPKELDEALRARVSQFFQAHVDRKLRLADEVVAEESKDYFLEMDKPKYRAFRISSVSYSDEFTQALVVVDCESEAMMLHGKVPVMMPLTTRWKLVDGKWYWFNQPEKERVTPFGVMSSETPNAPQPGQKPPVLPFGGMQSGASGAPPPPKIKGRVVADKAAVVLDPANASSDAITVSNSMEGWVSVQVFPPEVAGLTVKAESKDIAPGGSSRIVFEYQPSEAVPSATQAIVQVLPIGPVFRVKIGFKAPGQEAASAPEPVRKPRPAKRKTRR